MIALKTQQELIEHLRSYSALVHISGFGCQQQYADIDAVVAATEVPLFQGPDSMDGRFGRGKWACCFGGDPFNEAKPDVAALVQRLQSKHKMTLIAIQADKVEKEWGGVDKHIDVVYYYPTEYLEDGKTVAWGGLKGGRPVGTTRIMLEVNPCSGLPLQWIAAGGGDITLNELRAAWDHDISILFIEAQARLPQDPSLPCGPCKKYWESMQNYKEFGMFRASSQAISTRQMSRMRLGCAGWKALITGATGLLGREVLREFEERGWLARGCGFSRATGRVSKCDLLKAGEFEKLLDESKPDVVIHCAAERRPDVLENDKEYATRINVGITGDIGKLCKARGIWLIYLSTNYVFDGKEAPYAEDAAPNPVNTYGESKLAGERILSDVYPASATVRVPLLYGPIEYLGETSVTALVTAIQKDEPKLDNWQERFPTCSTDVARVLEVFAASYLRNGKANPEKFSGIFHWQANERHTKYTMGIAIAEIAGINSRKFVALNDAPAPNQAPRPQFERMMCGRLEGILQEEGSPDSFRSDFKARLEKHLWPFLSEVQPDASKEDSRRVD